VIVVDSNVIAYCWIRGARTEAAQNVRLRDPAWHVPILWRSEVRSALSGFVWRGTLEPEGAAAIMASAESALAGREHLVESGAVLELAARSRLSAYDCEFVALAQSLAVPLVTEDTAILKAFPDVALDIEGYLAAFPASPPAAHEKRTRYRTAGRKSKSSRR
jgi:predicted nucleic acid-binding protein